MRTPEASSESPPRLRRGLRWLARRRRRLLPMMVAAPAIAVVVVDALVRGERIARFRPVYLASYTAALLESLVLWSLLLVAASARRGRLRWAVGGLFVALFSVSMGAQIYFYRSYATYLNLDATLFGASVAGSIFGNLGADGANFASSLAPVVALAVALVWGARLVIRARPRTAVLATALAGPALLGALLLPCSYRSIQGSTPDVIYFHAFGGILKQAVGLHERAHVRPGRRAPPTLPPIVARPTQPRNVLFVLTESIRADLGCPAYRPSCPAMPFTNEAVRDRLPLAQMRASSSTTAIQLAVLWSGLSPNAGREPLHQAPLLFDYAHAAGMETAYWSSHHMMFANSRLFVQDLPTRFQCGATHLDPLADMDLGADDRLLTARIQEELPRLREPFFAVAHYGNTHIPYLVDDGDTPFSPHSPSKAPDDNEAYRNFYKNAVYRQDRTIAELLAFVRSAPFGPRTVIVYTADHGEAFREHGQLGHTVSLFDVELHVPAWVDAPPGTLDDDERAALASYADAPTFHTDVTPTVLDLLGLWDAPELATHRESMAGGSLLRAGRPERTLAMTNCSGVWGCALRNWGVMRGFRKLHARAWDDGWRCYDVAADPLEQSPLGAEACADLEAEANQLFGGPPGDS